MYSYKNIKFWNKTKLWKLRNEIMLNSLFVSDYENSFKIPAKLVCDFFDGYVEYLGTILDESETMTEYTWQNILNLDSKENLWNWFNCFEVCPFEDDPEYY
jgi:hypothetical protein